MTNDVKQRPSNHLAGSAVPEVVNRSQEEKIEGNHSMAATPGAPRKGSPGRTAAILLIAVVVVSTPGRTDTSSAGTSTSDRTSYRVNCWPRSNRRR